MGDVGDGAVVPGMYIEPVRDEVLSHDPARRDDPVQLGQIALRKRLLQYRISARPGLEYCGMRTGVTYNLVGGLVVGDLLADQLVAPLLCLVVRLVGNSWHDERHLGQRSGDCKVGRFSVERHFGDVR